MFQFHSPSEHTINGKHLDAELQIKHGALDADGKSIYSMLGILFDSEDGGSAENPFLKSVFEAFATRND